MRRKPTVGVVCGILVSVFVMRCASFGSFSTQDMVTTLTGDLVPEEGKVAMVCASLTADPYDERIIGQIRAALPSPSAGVAGQPPVSTTPPVNAVKVVAGEAISNAHALLSALSNNAPECDAESMVRESVFGVTDKTASCAKKLNAAFVEVDSGKGSASSSRKRIVDALRDANLKSGDEVLRQLLRAARLIDLSPAVLVASLQLADGAERLADDLASNIPIARGLVRVGLRLIAAELVAWTFDRITDQLEKEKVVNPASVARTACRLREGAVPRGAVAGRVLKRAILRFNPNWGANEQYPMESVCTQIRTKLSTEHEKQDPCADMKNKVVAKDDSEKDRLRVLAPTLENQPDWVAKNVEFGNITKQRIEEATSLCTVRRRLPPTDQDGGVSDAGAPDGEVIEGGTTETVIPCTMDFLSHVASIMAVYQLKADEGRGAIETHLREIDSSLRGVDGRVKALEDRISGLKEELAVANKALDDKLGEEARLSRNSNDILLDWFECEHERARVRSARVKFVAELLQLCTDRSRGNNARLCAVNDLPVPSSSTDRNQSAAWRALETAIEPLCKNQPANSRFDGITAQGGAASVFADRLCDVTGNELQFDLNSASAFDLCKADLQEDAKNAIGNLFLSNAIANFRPRSVRVVGHSDQQRLGADCTSRYPSGNAALSLARARAVTKFLEPLHHGIKFAEPTGQADASPLEDCIGSSGSSLDECHKKNRRVSFQFEKPEQASFEARKCDKIAQGIPSVVPAASASASARATARPAPR